MKKVKISTLFGVLALSVSLQGFSQQPLPEVVVKAVRYKYLLAVNQTEAAQPVKILERRAAEYDVKSADFYEEDYDTYFVSFYIPEGQLLASYDKDGKLLTTAEKYKNVDLPKKVKSSLSERFPQWAFTHDIYLVNYHEDNNNVRKVYKLTLQNGDKRLKVKLNENGEFL